MHYLFLSEPIFPQNSPSLVGYSTSFNAAELDKNIVHSAIEGFVSFFHCLKVVFLAVINSTLIQVLFAQEAPGILAVSFNIQRFRGML